VSITIV